MQKSKVFERIKKIQQKPSQQSNAMKDKQGNILTNPTEVKARWGNTASSCTIMSTALMSDDTVLLEIPGDLSGVFQSQNY